MSTIKVASVQNPSALNPAITLAADSTATLNGLAYPTSGSLSGRNRIINGDMRIDQRNAGAAVSLAASIGGYTLDRWSCSNSSDGAITVQRSTAAPAGFANSLLWTTTTADTSLAATQYALVSQPIEGFNTADLNWGSSNATSVTLSFWVRSSLTGTFSGSIRNSAGSRSYVYTYSISAANTWEYKSITVTGDTTGTWANDNGVGVYVWFSLGQGSSYTGTAGSWQASNLIGASGTANVIGTTSATFYLTGVQLEAGSVATPFERRSYGQELALCQRYYEKSFDIDTAPSNGPNATSFSTLNGVFGACALNGGSPSAYIFFKVQKRAQPTFIAYGNSNGHWIAGGSTWSANVCGPQIPGTHGVPLTQQQFAAISTMTGHWTASSEL